MKLPSLDRKAGTNKESVFAIIFLAALRGQTSSCEALGHFVLDFMKVGVYPSIWI